MNVTGPGVPAGSAASNPPPGSPRAKLMQAAHDLESVFYDQLFQAMREASPDGGMIEASPGEKMFTSMLDDEVSKLASRQTDRGLATVIYQQLSRDLPPDAAQSPSSASKP